MQHIRSRLLVENRADLGGICQVVVIAEARTVGEYMISFGVISPRSLPSGGVPARLANVDEKIAYTLPRSQ